MMTTAANSLVADYLRRLERAARALPRAQRDELVAEIRDHLVHGVVGERRRVGDTWWKPCEGRFV